MTVIQYGKQKADFFLLKNIHYTNFTLYIIHFCDLHFNTITTSTDL